MENKKEVEGIKTFLAEKKPEPIKVFQFTKEMLPEIDKKKLKIEGHYRIENNFNSKIKFTIFRDWIECFIYMPKRNIIFEVGDYIGEDREGNYFVIKKDVFEKDWVKK